MLAPEFGKNRSDQTTSTDTGFFEPANSLDSGVHSRLYSRHGSKNGEPRGQNRPSRPGDGHQHRHDPFLREAGIVEAIAAYRRRIPLIRTGRYRNPKIRPQGSGTGVFAE